jgi:hypothetical protein
MDQSFKDVGHLPYVQATNDNYKGKALLKFSNETGDMNPSIQQFPRTKKMSYNQAKGMKLIPKDMDEFPEAEIKPRKSTRRKTKPNRLAYSVTKWVQGQPIILGLIGFAIFNSHSEIKCQKPLIENMEDFKWTKPMASKSEVAQQFFAYHTRLDVYNQHYGISDTEDDFLWGIEDILDHKIRKLGEAITVKLKVQWRDGEKSWEPVDNLKHQEPKKVFEYAMKKGLINKTGWEWVHEFINADEQLSKMKRIYAITKDISKFKFGIEVAKTPKHAIELDKIEGNNLWKEAIQCEIDQINEYKTFRVLADHEHTPPGYKRIPYHFVFDVKIDGRRKARLVAGGHRTEPPKEDTYSGVVSLEGVRMGFILAQLNNLMVCAGDVGNAFLYGKTRETVFVIAGQEFGTKLAGKRMIIDKSLYGLKTSSARFHEHLSERLRQLGYAPSKAYPDLWMKKVDDHYEYIARYVDDVISFSRDPIGVMNELRKTYVMKAVGAPEYYLGGNVIQLGEEWEKEGITTALSAETYIENVVEKLAKMVGVEEFPKTRYKTPIGNEYYPELDDSDFCSPLEASKYRSLIGSANWIVALGRFDIAYATSTLARYSAVPR